MVAVGNHFLLKSNEILSVLPALQTAHTYEEKMVILLHRMISPTQEGTRYLLCISPCYFL